MYPDVPPLDEPGLAVPASDVPVALGVLLVRVAMATDVLSVRRQSRPRPTWKSLAGYLSTPTTTRQARGRATELAGARGDTTWDRIAR
ncbi:MAG TPA: hypothetical protein VF391_06435 [Dermatophilaceae bacterium]